jgi:hypothetical protein
VYSLPDIPAGITWNSLCCHAYRLERSMFATVTASSYIRHRGRRSEEPPRRPARQAQLEAHAAGWPRPGLLRVDGECSVQRRDRFGGVIHEYAKAAA